MTELKQTVVVKDVEFTVQSIGMTLRDYFAAKAMQAHITNNLNFRPEDVAKWAYEFADAMLAERERGE